MTSIPKTGGSQTASATDPAHEGVQPLAGQGWAVVPGFLTPEKRAAPRADALALVDAPGTHAACQ